MTDTWEGVLILAAVTLITLLADYARRWMPVANDPDYVPPAYPKPGDYVPELDDEDTQPFDVEQEFADEKQQKKRKK